MFIKLIVFFLLSTDVAATVERITNVQIPVAAGFRLGAGSKDRHQILQRKQPTHVNRHIDLIPTAATMCALKTLIGWLV